MHEFRESMKLRSHLELVRITTSLRDSYQPEAVKAAEAELISRRLSDEEIKDAHAEIQEESELIYQKKQRQKATLKSVVQTANPTTKKPLSVIIRLIAVGFMIQWLYTLIAGWELHLLYFQEIDLSFDWFIHLTLLVVVPFASVGLWRFRKVGWLLFTGLMIYQFIPTLFLTGQLAYQKFFAPTPYPYGEDSFASLITISLEQAVIHLLLVSGLLYYMNRKNVIVRFEINKQTQRLLFLIIGFPFLLRVLLRL